MLDTPNGPNAQYMAALRARYDLLKADKLDLDMTRGKPSDEQIALSLKMLDDPCTDSEYGMNLLNYGYPDGLPEARKLAAQYLGTNAKNTLVLGNSSLNIMHDCIVQMRLHGGWNGKLRFICPVPGYDRHFKICEDNDIEMIPVLHDENGPDMEIVRSYVARDPSIVGMWCMPKFSNPTGITYSRATTRAIATMKASSRFRVFWDNAYAHHDLVGLRHPAQDVMLFARLARREDRMWMFGSFSKVTFPSAAISMLASSADNIAWYRKRLALQTIGPDKLRQMQHVRFLKNLTGIKAHMNRHRRILEPKFKAVYVELEKGLAGKGIATWSRPEGGYFISFEMNTGSAQRVVELATGVGLKLTPAGAAFPLGNDPMNRHIRVAPTSPRVEDVRRAAHVLALCAEIAHREAHPQTNAA